MTSTRCLVFYSWQSDLPNATNRGFIEKALENAAKAIRTDDSILIEPVIDRDTSGVPGSPEIARTIFDKIEQAQVFVCDVSIINQGAETRPTPNPNVLIELGYAFRALGPNHVIMVFNDAFGAVEQLPFDLRTRRAIAYRMQRDSEDRATERKRLAEVLAEGLRAIITGLDQPPPGEIVEPIALGEQVRDAVQASRPDRNLLVRRYMSWLANEIAALNPQYRDGKQQDRDELLIAAIETSEGLLPEFARISEPIAAMNDGEAAETLYAEFSRILDQYTIPAGFSGSFFDTDFDFPKFVGHELFVTFFSFLLRENRWDVIANLLEQNIYVRSGTQGRPGTVPFTYVSQVARLLTYRNERLRLNRVSLHADILNERHTRGELAQLIPMDQFTYADFFLSLRAQLQPSQKPTWVEWLAWSYTYMGHTPPFLLRASNDRFARQLLRPLGVEDIQTLRDRLTERLPELTGAFGSWLGRNPLYGFDPQTVGSS